MSEITELYKTAIKALKKHGPDPIVYITLFFGFFVGCAFVAAPYALGAVVLIGAFYHVRRTSDQEHQLKQQAMRHNHEINRVRAIKDSHRPLAAAQQPLLPLERGSRRPTAISREGTENDV